MHQRYFLQLRQIILTLVIWWMIIPAYSQQSNIQIKISGNAIDLHYKDVKRLAGGSPLMENNPLTITKVTESKGTYHFESSGKSLGVHIQKTSHPEVIGLYLSTPLDKIKGNEFQGIFFSSVPEFKQGITFYRYKPWNSWTKPVRIQHIKEM